MANVFVHESQSSQTAVVDSLSLDKSRSVCEKKRRSDTNMMLNEIETLVYPSKLSEIPSKKISKIQIMEKTCSFIRFYRKLDQSIENNAKNKSIIPSNVLQDLLIYSQRGFIIVVDPSSRVICCSSSTMGFLQSRDTEIVGTKLSLLLTSNDNDYIRSLIKEKKTETNPFLLHFTMNSPDILRTFICRAFWHQFVNPEITTQPNEGLGALILACSSIDKLSMYNLPIFYCENSLNFEFKISLDGKFTKIDEPMERYTGYSPGELIGRCLLDYVNWEQAVELMETISTSLTKGTDAIGCLQFCCKSKSWIWIQATIRVSQNVWNSRIDLLIFSCKALDYNDVIPFLAQANTSPIEAQSKVIIDSVLPATPESSASLVVQ
ncbi:bHLH-PAS domain containing transcription factor Clock [Oopsacas minuta]|uniref:BHLH-PAS domain containing transcription factor Clock n=1 Tax=Oopsacas minuta TaxID=111878 RepID=A0AAV7JUD3_9METZ|nr:bHLH-PAS domain containing transcription factor Clock [Oopsacas minuta]